MKKCSILILPALLAGNLYAVKFFSIKDKVVKEGPDRIIFKNDLAEPVKIFGRFFILDGCAPITPFCVPANKECHLTGLDASGLCLLQVVTAAGVDSFKAVVWGQTYSMDFPGESYIRSFQTPDKIEFIIKISEIIASINQNKPLSIEIIRSTKKE